MKINSKHLLESLRHSTALTALVVVALLGVYLFVEPTVSRSQTEDRSQFTISQDIGAEISFLTPASNITMASIAGLTGGVATGTTFVRVLTNDIDGFTMTIEASSTPAMQGETQGGTIPNYTPATAGSPDYGFSVPANTAEFGYTISATTSSDLAQKFLDDGAGNCNTSTNDTNGAATCWYSLFTTATSVINRTTATESSGATSTLFFKTHVSSNPVPALDQDTYTATATLTATVNP